MSHGDRVMPYVNESCHMQHFTEKVYFGVLHSTLAHTHTHTHIDNDTRAETNAETETKKSTV